MCNYAERVVQLETNEIKAVREVAEKLLRVSSVEEAAKICNDAKEDLYESESDGESVFLAD